MHWRCNNTDFELIARSGRALLFDAHGELLRHDYDIDEIERLLRDGGYALEELGPASGLLVGRFRGFSDRELYLGMRQLHVVDSSPSRRRRFLFFGS